MRLRLERTMERVKVSLWLAPTIATLVAIALATALPMMDRRIAQDSQAWFLFEGGAEGARELLSTIASSMISLTALVFSITVLVLQLASGQFSPRVIRTFLQEPATKVAMAVFVGTFVYAFVLLTKVRAAPVVFVPALSVWFAFVLILGSVGVFIRYIDRMANSVRAITVLVRVAAETRQGIDRMYPDAVSEEPEAAIPPSRAPDVTICHAGAPGVVTAVDATTLLHLAAGAGVLIALVPRIGDFVPSDAPLFRIWGSSDVAEAELRHTVAIESERTPHQDPAFGFRQLVDVAVRALSPGLNDPTTAVQALDQLHDLVRRLSRRHFPAETRADETGAVRLVLPRPTFDDYVRLAFEEIFEYGQGSVQVVRRLRGALQDCMEITPPARQQVLREQLSRLPAGALHSLGESDRDTATRGQEASS